MTSWYREAGPQADVVISSRIRLARNIKGCAFPNHLSPQAQRKLNERITKQFFSGNAQMKSLYLEVDLATLSDVERQLLVEKRLISHDLAEAAHPVETLIRRDEAVSIMLGEEDHIRVQAMAPGLNLDAAYQEALQAAILLEQELPVAFDERLGFLTACPTNVGTGMRASVMLHLPALTDMGQIRHLASRLAQLGLAVRGALGEGSEAKGCLYQVSNQITLGLSEEDLIADLKKAVSQTLMLEQNAGRKLLSSRRAALENRIYRSVGILKSARLLGQDEAEQHLSNLRWGLALGLIKSLDYPDLAKLAAAGGRAQIQKQAGQKLSAEERDGLRAELYRQALAQVAL